MNHTTDKSLQSHSKVSEVNLDHFCICAIFEFTPPLHRVVGVSVQGEAHLTLLLTALKGQNTWACDWSIINIEKRTRAFTWTIYVPICSSYKILRFLIPTFAFICSCRIQSDQSNKPIPPIIATFSLGRSLFYLSVYRKILVCSCQIWMPCSEGLVIYHINGFSSFSQYTVIRMISFFLLGRARSCLQRLGVARNKGVSDMHVMYPCFVPREQITDWCIAHKNVLFYVHSSLSTCTVDMYIIIQNTKIKL